MVSVERACAIVKAKELWDVLRPIYIKYGGTPTETKHIQGIIIFAFTDTEKGDATMLGSCNVESAIKELVKALIIERGGVVLGLG